MKTIETTVYTYDELPTEAAKEKALDWMLTGVYEFNDAWDSTKEDAENIGLRLTDMSDHEAQGDFINSAKECAEAIVKNHGESCETFKTATAFLADIAELDMEGEDYEDILADKENEFMKSLLGDYRIMYRKDCEYRESRKQLEESLRANEYTFTETGKRFG